MHLYYILLYLSLICEGDLYFKYHDFFLPIQEDKNKAKLGAPVISALPKDTQLQDQALSSTESAVARRLLSECRDVLRSGWTAAYIARWARGMVL